ncbi:MAG: glutamate 5-kinase [Kiritimatiellia bacterium]|jgi:glutamate 5-kinase
MEQRNTLHKARRVVIKVGTSLVTSADGSLALGRLGALCEELVTLRGQGREVLLVSSGAVGLGRKRLGLRERPTDTATRQACAAVGQGSLLAFYDTLLSHLGVPCAQVLLTEHDFLDRHRYLNLAAALERLLALGALPILNENDTVSVDEIALGRDRVFGDNDRLSALVASNLDADLLVLLTNVDGVYTGPPGSPAAERIVTWTDQKVEFGQLSDGGTGGMQAKIAAARIASSAGVPTIIASGLETDTLSAVLRGEDRGTLIPAGPAQRRHHRWLAHATATDAHAVINQGAVEALRKSGASLLPIGVQQIVGDFVSGAIIDVRDASGRSVARGVAAYSSERVSSIMGTAGHKPLIHRDKLVLLDGGHDG